ncbi:MAG: T9SS type A sorting domain-containing protein [Bacteroidetes bacterium]|nr:T9SS type A sorting domain-containing protein [Bacteroidota bacterium]
MNIPRSHSASFATAFFSLLCVLTTDFARAQHWSAPRTIAEGLSPGNYHLKLYADDTLHTIFQNYTVRGSIYYSTGDTAAWSVPQPISGTNSFFGSFALSPTGKRSMVFSRGDYPHQVISLSRFDNGSWKSPVDLYDGDHNSAFPAVAYNQDTLLIAWMNGTNNYMDPVPGDVYTGIVSADTILHQTKVSTGNKGAWSISIVKDANNTPSVLWQSLDARLESRLYHSLKTSGQWTAPTEIGYGRFPVGIAGPEGMLQVIYHNEIKSRIGYRQYNGTSWSGETVLPQSNAPSSTGHGNHKIVMIGNTPLAQWSTGESIMMAIQKDGRWSRPRLFTVGTGEAADIAVTKGSLLNIVWKSGGNMYHSFSSVDTIPPVFASFPKLLRDTIEAGTPVTVNWKISGSDTMFHTEIAFSTDLGATWKVIDTVASRETSYTFTPPVLFSDSCLIRMTADDFWLNKQSAYSTTFSIRNLPPRSFSLSGPLENTIVTPNIVAFTWEASADISRDTIRYSLRVKSMLAQAGLDTTFPPTLTTSASLTIKPVSVNDTMFAWSVIAHDGIDSTMNIGGPRTFIRPIPPPILPFPLFQPFDSARSNVPNLQFTWRKPMNRLYDIMRYHLRIFSAPADSAPPVFDTLIPNILSTSLTVGKFVLLPVASYADSLFYWHVLADDGFDTVHNIGGERRLVLALPAVRTIPSSIDFGTVTPAATVFSDLKIYLPYIRKISVDSIYFIRKRFFTTAPSIPPVLVKGDTLTISVGFSPDSLMMYEDTLVISGEHAAFTIEVPVHGTASYSVGIPGSRNDRPVEFGLSQNFPNPFNPSTVIPFHVKTTGRTTLRLYDVLGRDLMTLFDQIVTPGSYSVEFVGKDLPSGVYICVMHSGPFTASRKLLLAK